MVQHSSQELRDNGVHEVLAEWEDALQEGNMATPSGGGQHQVVVLLGNTFRNGWREGGREGGREKGREGGRGGREGEGREGGREREGREEGEEGRKG